MSRFTMSCALLTAPLVWALVALAQDQSPPDRVPSFTDLDRDNDGYLNRGETLDVDGLADVFDVADVDRDGRLSVAEFSKAVLEGSAESQEAAGSAEHD
jgi:Ca2+-binding EF-hand superfamily protein